MAVFPVAQFAAARRHPLTGGLLLECSPGDVLSPVDGRVVSCGVQRRIGSYVVVYSKTFNKFFRLMSLETVVVEAGQYVRPGHALGSCGARLYYDVMVPGANPTFLPDGAAPGLFAPVRAYHAHAALKGM